MTEALSQPNFNPAPVPIYEAERLKALRRYNILDTSPEAAFDRITTLAARLFGTPIALISLVDESRGWFKSCYGFDLREIDRDTTICTLALLSDEVLVIPDTQQDARLACNPFVQSEPGLRFYAGAPLITHDGFTLGTLCLLDTKPGSRLTDEQIATLTDLAAMVIDELELRLAARKIAQIDAVLLEVTQGVAATTGETFFYALVQHFAKVLEVDYAYIGLVADSEAEKLETIAVCAKGEIADNFAYSLSDTPCQDVLRRRKLCCYPHSVQAAFPNAPLLNPLNVESYVAVPFFDSHGTAIGLLGIMHSKPLENVQLAESLLTIFALRIATELERQHTETARQQAQSELENLVEQRTIELFQTNEQLRLEITERQQAKAALETEQDLLKAVLDHVQAAIVSCDAEGILTLFNRSAREFHGLPEQPLPPEHWAEQYDLYHADGKTRMQKEDIPLFRALKRQTVDNVEMMIVPKHGTARTLLASGQAIIDAQGQQQGAVVVMHDITDRKQAEAERAQLIHEQAARLEAEADQQRSAFLVEIATVLASSLNYEQTLASVANLVVPFFADWCAVDLLGADRAIHRVSVAHQNVEKVNLGWELHRRYPRHIDEAEGISKVLRTGKPEFVAKIPDAAIVAAAHDTDHLQMLRDLGLQSCIISPLVARGQTLGAISFVTAESNRHYCKADLALAGDVAHRVAIAIDNARLYQEAQQAQQAAEQSAARVSQLQSVTAALSESLTPTQVAEVMVDQGTAALKASFALVALLNETSTELEIVRAVGGGAEPVDGWQRFSVNASVPLAKAVRTGQPIWAESSEERSIRHPCLDGRYEPQNFGSWISIPLMVKGRAVGGISFGFSNPLRLETEDQTFILSMAQQCAQAIVRTHLYAAEQNARSQAEAANRIKDEFLAVLSHELRTPLNPILGWAKLLRSSKPDEAKTALALETIERNAKLQSELIEDLLDVSRILQGKLSLNAAPVDLAVIIQAAMETVRLAAEAKSIHLQVILDSPVKPVSGDSNRLQQVVWNLLSNAVKFSPPGGRVTLRLEQVESGVEECKGEWRSGEVDATPPPIYPSTHLLTPPYAQITVSDTGKGIQPDFLPYVFDYFRQADGATTRKFGGLGLGLAIVRHLVEMHGGTVQAESAGEDLGATFRVRLPLIPSQPIHQNRKHLSEQAHNLSSLSILVVDDDTDSLNYVVFLLEQSGAKVTAVTCASEALAALAESRPDLLLSDIGMPEVDGYRLIQQIRKLPPQQGGQIPAIALTAFAGELDHQQALLAGFQRHVSKPVEPDNLIKVVADLVEQGG